MKMKKSIIVLPALAAAMAFFAGCSNVIEESDANIVIGDKIIYGEEYSLKSIYETSFRSLCADESQKTEMVYFSVSPANLEELENLNSVMGYLNPIEMNKDIIQSCDAESLIFKSDIETENIEDSINFNITYYYILTKEEFEEKTLSFNEVKIIEEYSMIAEEADFDEEENISSGAAARSAVSKNKISGTVKFTLDGKTVPAYGIKLSGNFRESSTDKDGHFSLGEKRDIFGLVWLYANYENSACKLTEILNFNTSTLLAVKFPSSLVNANISAKTNYSRGKMAICRELLERKNDSLNKGKNIPQAKIWTTIAGKGTSSSPCFNYTNFKSVIKLPDIILTDCNAYTHSNIKVLHHEYTHYLHNVYAENKGDFWTSVVNSETIQRIPDCLMGLFPGFEKKETDYYYDFSNAYVDFTECLAEWYSNVALARGMFEGKHGSVEGDEYNSSRFPNSELLSSLISNIRYDLNTEEKPDYIMNLVDTYDIRTFQELYDALVTEEPEMKDIIMNTFQNFYIVFGNSINYGDE